MTFFLLAFPLLEIDLRRHPRLRLLRFNLGLEGIDIIKSQDYVIQWFASICASISSDSLALELDPFSEDLGVCNRIQDILLALYSRIEIFLVYLPIGTQKRRLFSKLYEVGIVVEGDLREDRDDTVCH